MSVNQLNQQREVMQVLAISAENFFAVALYVIGKSFAATVNS